MDNEKVVALLAKLKIMVETRGFEVEDNDIELELNNALLEYYNDRHYKPTDDEPFEPIYEGIILQLALSGIAKMGAEGQNYHSEGGVIRTYDSAANYPLALTQKIIPLAKGVD